MEPQCIFSLVYVPVIILCLIKRKERREKRNRLGFFFFFKVNFRNLSFCCNMQPLGRLYILEQSVVFVFFTR